MDEVDSRADIGFRQSPARRAVLTVLIVGAFALVFPLWAWATLGAGEAARAATELAMPVGAAWLLLLAGGLWNALSGRRRAAVLLLGLWGLVGILFSQPFVGWSLRQTEAPPTALPADHPPFAAVIVLGGGAGRDPLNRPELSRDGQRVLSAAQFWHAGKTRTVITTGASAVSPTGPAEVGAELLESVGVPRSVIFQVSGENTAQEMRHLRAFFEAPPADFLRAAGVAPTRSAGRTAEAAPGSASPSADSAARPRLGEVGLITSAFHMPRAQRLAHGQDIEFTPLPCSFRTGSDEVRFSPRDLVPDAAGVDRMTLVLKEWLAWVVGR